MTGILDRVANGFVQAHPRRFRPASPQEFFALRLAGRLNDAGAVRHYVELCDRRPEGELLSAYRRAAVSGSDDLARTFHLLLEHHHHGAAPKRRDLAAIRIERRAIAIASFTGERLKYPPIARQLSSDSDKALGSAAIFVDHFRDKCAFDNTVLELLPQDSEAQRSQLAKIVTEVLIQRQTAIWQYPKAEVLAAYGNPPLDSRREVREVMSAMWPQINGGFGSDFIRNALALGLYCQVEQLFSLEN